MIYKQSEYTNQVVLDVNSDELKILVWAMHELTKKDCALDIKTLYKQIKAAQKYCSD